MRRVLITGVTGFAGSHLVDYLLTRSDFELHGIWRWRSRTENIEHLAPGAISLHECDLRDATSTFDGGQAGGSAWVPRAGPTGRGASWPRARCCAAPSRCFAR